MPAEKSNWYADAVLNLARGQAPPNISGLEASLWHVVPAKDGTGGTEVASGGYTRKPVTLGAPGAGTSGRKSVNTDPVIYPQATADYPDQVRGWVIHRTNGAKEMLWIHTMAQPRDIYEGDVPLFGTGEMQVEEA